MENRFYYCDDIENIKQAIEEFPAHQFTPWAWCPLFGGFPPFNDAPNAPTSKSMNLIYEARKLWGIYCDGPQNDFGVTIYGGIGVEVSIDGEKKDAVTDCPQEDLFKKSYDYPWMAIEAARAIFSVEDLMDLAWMMSAEKWGIAEYRGEMITASSVSQDSFIKATLFIARKIPAIKECPEVLPDYFILSMLAIKQACIAFKQALLYGEVGNVLIKAGSGNINLGNPLENAIMLLARAEQQAFIENINGMKPDAMLGKNNRENQKNFGIKRGKSQTEERQPEWDKWRACAKEIKAQNRHIKSKIEIARKVKEKLKLKDAVSTIRAKI